MSCFPCLSLRYCRNYSDIIIIIVMIINIIIVIITVVSCCTALCCCSPHYVLLLCDQEVLKCLSSLPLSSISKSDIQIGLPMHDPSRWDVNLLNVCWRKTFLRKDIRYYKFNPAGNPRNGMLMRLPQSQDIRKMRYQLVHKFPTSYGTFFYKGQPLVLSSASIIQYNPLRPFQYYLYVEACVSQVVSPSVRFSLLQRCSKFLIFPQRAIGQELNWLNYEVCSVLSSSYPHLPHVKKGNIISEDNSASETAR